MNLDWDKHKNTLLIIALILGIFGAQQQYYDFPPTIIAIVLIDLLFAYALHQHALRSPQMLKSSLMGFSRVMQFVAIGDFFIAWGSPFFNVFPHMPPIQDVFYLVAVVLCFYHTLRLPWVMEHFGIYPNGYGVWIQAVGLPIAVLGAWGLAHMETLKSFDIIHHFAVIFWSLSFGMQALFIKEGKVGSRIRIVSIVFTLLNAGRVLRVVFEGYYPINHFLYMIIFALTLLYLMWHIDDPIET